MKKLLLIGMVLTLIAMHTETQAATPLQPADTSPGQTDSNGQPIPNVNRTIKIDIVVLEQRINYNRLGSHLPNGQIYALLSDLVPSKAALLVAGNVRLRRDKRPRPIVLRANVGDTLDITLYNMLPKAAKGAVLDCDHAANATVTDYTSCAGLEIMGLDWVGGDGETPSARVAPGAHAKYTYYAKEEGVFMLYSPNGQGYRGSQLDYGLFGAVNVQPQQAEWYRSQVTRTDLQAATYRVSETFLKTYVSTANADACGVYIESSASGLPDGFGIRLKSVSGNRNGATCPNTNPDAVWQLLFPAESGTNPGGAHAIIDRKISDVRITPDGYLNTLAGQPMINYRATYSKTGYPVLSMLTYNGDQTFQLVYSALTAIITGPNAGRFPYYVESPSFYQNPAAPDRRQPFREVTVTYHITPFTNHAFAPFNDENHPLHNTLRAGKDGFGINYGIAGIGAEIWANRTHVGPMGINRDGVELSFEEFFLSSWAVGDPAMVVDIPANNPAGARATIAYYPDDPSNVYHSYMRDHLKMRVLNTGSATPHVHHQHAHQWLHTPNSSNSMYLDSQLINPGSTYTAEMVYNGSGNRNQTVGDSIFHCHFYPHFATGMWALWRVHDVFEAGTELDAAGRPLPNARALPDGEIMTGTPIPAVVPLPTLAMAPMPAPVRLINNGRQVEVLPVGHDDDGNPIYANPGFPFFIPGIAGHRAPHPPMDFGWKTHADGSPKLHTAQTADAFHPEGQRVYLDGGLPRHLILGGTLAKERHTRWDFTKDLDTLIAMHLPEAGTAIEQVAMQAHATRTHASYLPDGRPGNFVLNGLPPAPGAPYAAPEADDFGNSTFNERRYKAAVIQKDVVFNKEGWHFPQQRFITLLDDVKDTMSGAKPPEPFFFRAETGETVEFWHTNLVPEYYELDDFQVRTPTDILGQHIHLVKFDVTASDGAGNGFNYEDGTFSPQTVQARIDAINENGGLYHYDTNTQQISNKQDTLTVSKCSDDYPHIGCPDTARGKSYNAWDGAQTTVQRFDTDPLLNNQGEDRTLRTVFTHDHFGPSTHQQAGLYGAMLVEPAGSTWRDNEYGCIMPGQTPNANGDYVPATKSDGVTPRDDGGPTSWSAVIETADTDESYREFSFAVGDLQLAYKAGSPATLQTPNALWFSIPNNTDPVTGNTYSTDLNAGKIDSGLASAFSQQGMVLGGDTRA